MIKSTRTSIKFANTSKRTDVRAFVAEYRNAVSQFVDLLWPLEEVPKFITKDITSKLTTWLSARALQAAAKQASGIVRGTRRKQSKRIYVYNKLLALGQHKRANKLKRYIDAAKISKPKVDQVCPELDSRFVKVDLDNSTSYDGWITLSSLGGKLKLALPFKRTVHFNRLHKKGKLKQGVRLTGNSLTFNFMLPEVAKRDSGQAVGLDIGVKNTYTLSNGIASQQCNHGHTLDSINKKLVKKQKGSAAFGQAQTHRTNYINWSLNQINFTGVKSLRIENIKHLRRNKRTSRYLSHFTYTELYNKIKDLTQTNGVHLVKVNPTYTSQRCSKCGWVRSSNRRGKQFKCGACKFECDADLNAAVNIAAELPGITKAARLKQRNRKGFYWNEASPRPALEGKLIVSPAKKLK